MKIRKMTRKDLPAILNIEEATSPFPLALEELNSYLRSSAVTTSVVEEEGRLIAFIITSIGTSRFTINRLAVTSKFRRSGIGSMLVTSVKKQCTSGRGQIVHVVLEDNLGGQLFLQKNGFVATDVIKEHYNFLDGYKMVWSLL